MDIIEAIEKRISCRAYTTQQPDAETIGKLEREIAAINDEAGMHFQLYGPREDGTAINMALNMFAANPPYYAQGSGGISPDPARAAARGEACCSLEELCAAAAWLLPSGGRFCLVHKPERLSELFCAMTARGLEPKRLRLVTYLAERAPSLVLVEGRRGGRPGLTVEPPLILADAEGRESAEYRRIYHR